MMKTTAGLSYWWARPRPSAEALRVAARAFFACMFGKPAMAVSCPEVTPPWGSCPHWALQILRQDSSGWTLDEAGALREKATAIRQMAEGAGSSARAAGMLELSLRRLVVFELCGYVAEQLAFKGACDVPPWALGKVFALAPLLRRGRTEILRLAKLVERTILRPENLLLIWALAKELDRRGHIPQDEAWDFLPLRLASSVRWPGPKGMGAQGTVGFWRSDYPFPDLAGFLRALEHVAAMPGPASWQAELLRAFKGK